MGNGSKVQGECLPFCEELILEEGSQRGAGTSVVGDVQIDNQCGLFGLALSRVQQFSVG